MNYTPRMTAVADSTFDIIIIGTGFGGLGAALQACELGLRVAVCETLKYPGGCASTFEKFGHRFEAGATLPSGFGEKQLFRRWIDQYKIPLRIEWLDPVIRFRSGVFECDISRNARSVELKLMAIPGAPVEHLRRFFTFQQTVSETVWGLFDDPDFDGRPTPSTLLKVARAGSGVLSVAQSAGRTVHSILHKYELHNFEPLKTYLNALCQITLQCSSKEADAVFAFAAMDYYDRGAAHVHGGLGALADGLIGAIRKSNGTIFFSNHVLTARREKQTWVVGTRRGELRARAVIANVLPAVARDMLHINKNRAGQLNDLQQSVEAGWGACMLYMVADPARLGRSEHGPAHYQMIDDAALPNHGGNHVFLSVGGDPGPSGLISMTASTHVPMCELLSLPEARRGIYIHEIQERMRRTIDKRAPVWSSVIRKQFTASPRTFERFTGRPQGFVGGTPRKATFKNYVHFGPVEAAPRFVLVGDSIFPGQSILATAMGGRRAAVTIAQQLKS